MFVLIYMGMCVCRYQDMYDFFNRDFCHSNATMQYFFLSNACMLFFHSMPLNACILLLFNIDSTASGLYLINAISNEICFDSLIGRFITWPTSMDGNDSNNNRFLQDVLFLTANTFLFDILSVAYILYFPKFSQMHACYVPRNSQMDFASISSQGGSSCGLPLWMAVIQTTIGFLRAAFLKPAM